MPNEATPPPDVTEEPVEETDLMEFDDLTDEDLAEAWFRATSLSAYHYRRVAEFYSSLNRMVSDPDRTVEIQFCTNCSEPNLTMRTGRGGGICQACIDNGDVYQCCDCGLYATGTITTLADEEVCTYCRDDHWRYCENCDGYYNINHESHESCGYCQCPSPKEDFTVPHPDGAVRNDTRVNVALPEGVISDVGLEEISGLLHSHVNSVVGRPVDRDDAVDIRRWRIEQATWHAFLDQIDEVGDAWSNDNGTYTKRLSRFAYKVSKVKVPPALLTQIGNVASAHSRSVNFDIEVTRMLNLSPEEFCHEDSCWWQSYTPSRCTLKSNGGFGIRTFSGYPQGRCWVLPLKLDDDGALTPTFDTVDPAAYVTFNGYGDLEMFNAPRIMGHLTGWPYKRIDFAGSPMYVNAGGYLVAPEGILSLFAEGGVNLSLDPHSDLFNRENQSEVAA